MQGRVPFPPCSFCRSYTCFPVASPAQSRHISLGFSTSTSPSPMSLSFLVLPCLPSLLFPHYPLFPPPPPFLPLLLWRDLLSHITALVQLAEVRVYNNGRTEWFQFTMQNSDFSCSLSLQMGLSDPSYTHTHTHTLVRFLHVCEQLMCSAIQTMTWFLYESYCCHLEGLADRLLNKSMCTHTNTHRLSRGISPIREWLANKHLHAPNEVICLCSSDFLLHRETALQCHTAFYTAEGHRFYVPCMQLINFCYFVVCVRLCVSQPHKALLLRAFCIPLIS